MLATFVLATLIGLGLLTYFWPAASDTPTFEFTRKSLICAMLAYAGTSVVLKIVAATGDDDAMPFAILFEIAGWACLAVSLRGLFVMLGARARHRAAQASSVPD